MGILGRLLRTADRAYQAKEDVEFALVRDRRFDRAAALAESGSQNEAVVTGIRRRFNDGTTDTDVRLEWFAPDQRAAAIHFGADMPLVVRLGSTVAIRSDGDSAVLDPVAMAGTPAAPKDAGRRSRRVPPQGVDDTALDSRVLSRINKWPTETAVVHAFEQARTLGMLVENWTIVVRRADGTEASVSKDHVPPYARWYVHPGAEVPIVVDPKDPSRAQVDWPLLAEQRSVAGGRWQDPAPEGSLARAQLAGSPAEPELPVASATVFEELSSAIDSDDTIEGITVQRCAFIDAALTKLRLPPADHDAAATREYGVPAERWAPIKDAWQARIRADWKVGAAYGQAYADAQRQLKRR